MSRKIGYGLLVLLLTLVLGCIKSDAPGNETPSPGATVTPLPGGGGTPANPTSTATPEPFGGTRGPVQKVGQPPPPVRVLTDVQVGRHDTFDRIVFTFREGLPGYRIAYVQPPIVQDGSGQPVA